MALIACSECGREISDQAASCPHCGAPRQGEAAAKKKRLPGFEYRSERMVGKRPLVHVAFGFHPETGKLMVARGFIAIGIFARGFIAIGSFALGVVTFAGFGLGLVTFAGVAGGLLAAAGGVAVGAVAVGGVAVGAVAVGGMAIGYYALGGLAIGCEAMGGRVINLCPPPSEPGG